VAVNGNLIGSFTISNDSFTEEYTWNLTPLREP
jgi:hypothetical protein